MAGRMYSKRTTQGVRIARAEAREKVGQVGEREEARRGRDEGLDSWQGSEEEWMILFLHEQLDGRDGYPEGASLRRRIVVGGTTEEVRVQSMEVVAEGVMLVWWGGWRVAARGMHWERAGEEGRMRVTSR